MRRPRSTNSSGSSANRALRSGAYWIPIERSVSRRGIARREALVAGLVGHSPFALRLVGHRLGPRVAHLRQVLARLLAGGKGRRALVLGFLVVLPADETEHPERGHPEQS